jgi:uncharacterized protein (DUF305 family)
MFASARTLSAQTPVSCLSATPAAPAITGSDASPAATELPDTDFAWMTLQELLASSSETLALTAQPFLLQEDLQAYAGAQIATAGKDLETLGTWRESWYPGASYPLEYSLATIFNGKRQLDLPAGAGGTGALGAESGISQLCLHPDQTDAIYLQSSLDLAQQQIDLAQVAVVFAGKPEIVAYAQEVIEREQTNIGQLLTWQEDLLNPESATPAA